MRGHPFLRRCGALIAASGCAVLLIAATPPTGPPPGQTPPPGAQPPSGASAPTPDSAQARSDAQKAAVSVARKSAILLALGALGHPPDGNLMVAVGSLGLTPSTDRATLATDLSNADAAAAPIMATLLADGVQPGAEVAKASQPLSGADSSAAAAGNSISVSPDIYLTALADLLLRDGRPSLTGASPDPSQIATQLRSLLNLTPAASPSASAATTLVPDAPVSTTASGIPWWAPVLATIGLLCLLLAAMLVVRRRMSGSAESSAAAVDVHELLEVSRRLTAAAAGGETERAIVRESLALVPAEAAALVRRTPQGLSIAVESHPGTLVEERLGDGALGRVAETGQPLLQVSATEPAVRSLPIALVAVPLVVGGAVAAVLVLVRRGGDPFQAEDRDLLSALAPVAAATLHNAVQARTAVEESLTDALTGVGNRRRLESELDTILGDAASAPTSFVMVDLDHFKSINDTHGHPAGDAVLRGVAAVLRTTVRPGDRVYRFGGEEFCIVLPETVPDEAREVAERVRQAIAAHPFDIGGGQTLRATASLGVAAGTGVDRAALVSRADEALYRAKESGRNQVAP